MDKKKPTLLKTFEQVAQQFPDAAAIEVEGCCQNYRQLYECGRKISGACRAIEGAFAGVFVGKSTLAYASVLGILGSGRAYIPLNLDFPEARLASMIRQSGLTGLVVDRDAIVRLLAFSESTLLGIKTVLVDSAADAAFLEAGLTTLSWCPQIVTIQDQMGIEWLEFPAADPAYMLFTSGSTGQPKGIAISRANLTSYLEWALKIFPLTPKDRCSQTFALSFDLSVHDIFVTLSQGACLVVPSAGDLLFPAHYVAQRHLSSWFSVPSLALRIKQLGILKPHSLPELRYVLFCGEGLPQSTAEAWAEATPQAQIFNLYGPTEATIACTFAKWTKATDEEVVLVPIGHAFPTMRAEVFDAQTQSFVNGLGQGELWLSGPQLADGYVQDPQKTAEVFVNFAAQKWYRTGDLVARKADGALNFIGRLDYQVKIRGFRIELGEIEKFLYQLELADLWVALPWPWAQDQAQEVVALYSGAEVLDSVFLQKKCATFLAPYMVPSGFHRRQTMPLNSNGKIDRAQLAAELLSDGILG